jgi:hypothetical protein
MTNTTISTRARAKQWDTDFFREYVRDNRYKPFMGSNENAVIQVNMNLTKNQGDAFTFNLVGAIDATAGPNTGGTALVGTEKVMPNDGWQVTVGVVRDAVVINGLEVQASAFDAREAARVQLKELSNRYLRNSITTALGSIDGIPYATATAAQRNSWNAANADRVLYGNLTANYNATMATALTSITGTQTLTRAVVSMAKRRAMAAVTVNGEGLRPVRYGQDFEAFVMFVDSRAFRDLTLDMSSNWQNAMPRSEDNPLFKTPMSLYWDNVLVVNVPSIASLGNVGAGGTVAVSPYYLCGAQAIGLAWAQTTTTTVRKEDDYGFQRGVGFMEIRGLGKIQWAQGGVAKDWGVLSGFVAAAADA